MPKFIVISYDEDQQQWFYDTVGANTADQAIQYVCAIRSYVLGADALSQDELSKMVLRLIDRAPEWDASQALAKCWDCEGVFPEDKLDPIKDLGQRVEAGETMPAGQCPECGALCHLLDDSEPKEPPKEYQLFLNYYRCPSDGEEWTDKWSCMCNDACPKCGLKDIEPYKSEEVSA